jgi:sulfite exporter TauE/SafE
MVIKIKKQTLLVGAVVGLFVIIGLLLLRSNSLEHPLPGAINLWAVFLTGLVTGGLTCLAVQGGLLAATIAQREEQKLTDKILQQRSGQAVGNALPILSFLIAKLVVYTLLGFLLGVLGSVVQLSLTAKVIMQFAVAIFMLGTAFNILNVHPIFRYFAIQPPKFLTRLVRKQSKRGDLFAPVLLGAFTVFIPCGTTQAMMALAIGSGNPFLGAATLFAFILGTSPLFFILGYFATKLGDALHQKFMKVAAWALILLAVFNLNGVIALTGSNLTLDNIWMNIWCRVSFCNTPSVQSSVITRDTSSQKISENSKTPAIIFEDNGYITQPNNLSVKAGSQVTLQLVNTNGQGCIQAFTIPTLGIQKIVSVGTSDSITFTAPETVGQLPFMCSMGMYRGFINII